MTDCPQSKPAASGVSGLFKPADVVLSKRALKQVGAYVLGARLGRGSFAQVKEGYHVERPQSRLAVKIINLDRLRKKMLGDMSTYMREIAMLKTLNHPRIVSFVDSFEDARRSKLYIALEYMAGGDLQHLIDVRALSTPETRGVFRSLIEGLSYLHAQGIVHQDIKPSNLLINGIGAVKISDFGVAQYVNPDDEDALKTDVPDELSRDRSTTTASDDDDDDDDEDEARCSPCVIPVPALRAAAVPAAAVESARQTCYAQGGAPAFQPPEMAVKDGPTIVNPATDVWSAGITLYRLVVGSFPFPIHNSNVYELLNTIARGDFTIPDDLDDELQSLLRRLLDVDPHRRIQASQVLEHPWLAKHSDDAPLRVDAFLPTLFNDSDLDSHLGRTPLRIPPVSPTSESLLTGEDEPSPRGPSSDAPPRPSHEQEPSLITGEDDDEDNRGAAATIVPIPHKKKDHCVDLCAVL